MIVYVLHEPDDEIIVFNTKELAQKTANRKYPGRANKPSWARGYCIEGYEVMCTEEYEIAED